MSGSFAEYIYLGSSYEEVVDYHDEAEGEKSSSAAEERTSKILYHYVLKETYSPQVEDVEEDNKCIYKILFKVGICNPENDKIIIVNMLDKFMHVSILHCELFGSGKKFPAKYHPPEIIKREDITAADYENPSGGFILKLGNAGMVCYMLAKSNCNKYIITKDFAEEEKKVTILSIDSLEVLELYMNEMLENARDSFNIFEKRNDVKLKIGVGSYEPPCERNFSRDEPFSIVLE